MAAIEEIGESAARMSPHLKRLGFVLSHLGVAAVSVAVTMKKLEKKYSDLANIEINEAREYYKNRVEVVPQYSTPAEAVQALIGEPAGLDEAVDALAIYQGVKPGANVVETTVALTEVSANVFTDAGPKELDLEKEVRDPEKPYVITEAEFMAAEFDYEQANFTYYLGDEVLTAEDESIVENVDYTVGSENLRRFGDGSNDPNVVYVRNVKLKLDYEIVKSFGKYSVEVAGLDDEESLQHSYSRMPKRRHHLTDD